MYAVAVLLLQNTYGGCFWIFAAANTFFQLSLVFIADSRTGFCSELFWNHWLNLRSSHRNSSVKKGVIRNFANFLGKHMCWSPFLTDLKAFRPALYKKRDSNADAFLKFSKFLEFTKKRFRHRCFLVNSAKFLITPF